MKSIIFSESEIEEIRQNLPHGAIARIAKKLNREYSGVHKVFRNKRYSQEVIEAGIQELESGTLLRQRFEQLKSKIA